MAILVGPAILGTILSIATGRAGWIVLIGVYLLMGVALDVLVYPWLLRYQPPWMTGVLGLGEFGLLYVLAQVLKLDLSPAEAIIFYWVCWFMAAATKIVILPIASLTYLESSGEFRSTSWSIPPEQSVLPIVAAEADVEAAPGQLVERASGVHQVPLELKPSPSGIHRVRV